MCYNCGCSNIFDDMGNPDNITDKTIRDLASNLGKNVGDTKLLIYNYLNSNKTDNKVLEEKFQKAANAWGQKIEEAKKETHHELRRELKLNY